LVNSIRWENTELRRRFQEAADEMESLQNEIEQYKREILLRDETIQKLKQAFEIFEEQQRKPVVGLDSARTSKSRLSSKSS